MRSIVAILAVTLWAGALAAQDRAQTLADIRQELSVLYVDIQRLKTELSTTGAPQTNTGSGTMLDRVDAIERALQQLTAQTEELEFRIDRVVADGTIRIGDLEFRLVELEGGDVSQLGQTTTLGGDAAVSSTPAAAPTPVTNGPQLANQEAADFDRAQASFDQGDFTAAAAQFKTFNETYPGGPMAVQADLRMGQSLLNVGDTREGARAFLRAFTADQNGPNAAEALYRLGAALGALGTQTEACVTLAEVGVRFPGSAFVGQATEEQSALNCG